MSMDSDFDFTFNPSGTIYGARAIMLDVTTVKGCFLGSLNARCIGVTPQQSENPPGMIGNTTFPMPLAEPTSSSTPFAPGSQPRVPAYGPGRKCLIDIDPNFAGQVAPNDLIVSSNSGYGTKATPTGPWNQWIIGRALSFASGGQPCNILVEIFPWLPTGS